MAALKVGPFGQVATHCAQVGGWSGRHQVAYMAVERGNCYGCGRVVEVGEFVTRHKRAFDAAPLPRRGPRRPAQFYCQECWPCRIRRCGCWSY